MIDECQSLNECICQNGGTCINSLQNCTCQCTRYFTGTNCETEIGKILAAHVIPYWHSYRSIHCRSKGAQGHLPLLLRITKTKVEKTIAPVTYGLVIHLCPPPHNTSAPSMPRFTLRLISFTQNRKI